MTIELEFAKWLKQCCYDAEVKLKLTPLQVALVLANELRRYLLRLEKLD